MRLLYFLLFVVGITSYASAQVLQNSAKPSTDKNETTSVVNASSPETLNVRPAQIQAIKNASELKLQLSSEAFNKPRQTLDSLARVNVELNHITSKLNAKVDSLDKAERELKEARALFLAARRERKANTDLLRKIEKQKEEKAAKARKDVEEAELNSRFNALALAMKKIAKLNSSIADLKVNVATLDSSNKVADSLKILDGALIPDLRSKLGRNRFILTNLHTLFDSTHTLQMRRNINDSLSNISTEYEMIALDNQDLLVKVKNQIEDREIRDEKLKALSQQLQLALSTVNSSFSFDSTKSINNQNEKLNQVEQQLSAIDKDVHTKLGIAKSDKEYRTILKTYLSLAQRYKTNSTKLDNFQKATFKELNKNKKDNEMEFGALPNVSQLVGETRGLNLNISVIGAYSTSNDTIRTSFESRLFTGTIPKDLVNARSLFIPEISSFGVQVKYSVGWETKSNFGNNSYLNHKGLNFEVNLLNKKILSDSLLEPGADLNNFVAHFKGGYEQVIIKKRMSVYANASWFSLIDNVTNFHKQFDQYLKYKDKNSYWFGDFGARFLLLPGAGASTLKTGDLSIYADINFIIPGSWGRNIIQTDDKLFTLIKIGLKKSLGVIHR